jgi:hypothetical protein
MTDKILKIGPILNNVLILIALYVLMMNINDIIKLPAYQIILLLLIFRH